MPPQNLGVLGASPSSKKSPRKATPSPSGDDRLDQISRLEKWPSTLSNSVWETLSTILTSLQQGSGELQGSLLPHRFPPTRKYRNVQGLPHQFSHSPWSVHSTMESSLGGGEGGLTMALQSTTIHRYDWLVKPVFPPSLSPAYTFSRISVSGVNLNGKHE